jgi:hypothetical protein
MFHGKMNEQYSFLAHTSSLGRTPVLRERSTLPLQVMVLAKVVSMNIMYLHKYSLELCNYIILLYTSKVTCPAQAGPKVHARQTFLLLFMTDVV